MVRSISFIYSKRYKYTTNCDFKRDKINLQKPTQKNQIITFNSDEHDGDTNTDSNIEYILV